MMSYASFLVGALWSSFFHVRKPDLVITLTTPPFLSLIGRLMKLRGCRHYLWEMDLYPDVAVDVELLKPDAWSTRLLRRVAGAVRSGAHGVIVPGDCMRDRLAGVAWNKIHVAENWADGSIVHPGPYRKDGNLRLLYSGNLGIAHEVETISGAMEALRADSHFRFVFVGYGFRRKALEEWCASRGLENVSFQAYRERSKFSESLAAGDVGLITLKAACSGSVVPSKVYPLMAAARPFLFIGPHSATPARLIRRFQCGWHIENEDVEGLVALLRVLHSNPALIQQAGQRARDAFLEFYDRPVGVARLSKIIGVASPVEAPMSKAATTTSV